MEIKDILDNHSNDMNTFLKKNKIKYRKYSQDKCYIMKINTDDIVEEWQRNLRGLIYNYEEKKILVLPPPKSYEIEGYINDDITFTELFDGTMINIFYNNDKWNISSRSTIGCNNKWIMNKTYKELFEDTHSIEYETLNKNYSYSFVLRNKCNRNISYIENNEIILVKIFDTINLCDIELDDELGFKIPKVYNSMKNIDITDCRIKGFTYTLDNKRYKWLSLSFKRMKELKLNINNKSLMYYELRKNGNLKEYLHYFPEDSDNFSKSRDFFHSLKDKLHDIYFSIYVKKECDFKDINYEYKPLIKEIHQIYLSSGNKIRLKTIEDYLHNLPSKRLVFVMNFSK
jgi:hypothetical protein